MTRDEWVAAQLKTAPPLTQEQIAALRRLLLPTPLAAVRLTPRSPRKQRARPLAGTGSVKQTNNQSGA